MKVHAQHGQIGLLGPIVRHFVAMESKVVPGNVVTEIKVIVLDYRLMIKCAKDHIHPCLTQVGFKNEIYCIFAISLNSLVRWGFQTECLYTQHF